MGGAERFRGRKGDLGFRRHPQSAVCGERRTVMMTFLQWRPKLCIVFTVKAKCNVNVICSSVVHILQKKNIAEAPLEICVVLFI